MACICGDIVYHVHDSLVDPFHVGLASEPQVSGNHGSPKRQEKAAIKKALNSGRFLLPMHDRPARIEGGRVVARLTADAVPGPEVPVSGERRPAGFSLFVPGLDSQHEESAGRGPRLAAGRSEVSPMWASL